MLPVLGAGALWVPNAGDGTVSRVDTTSGRVVASIKVGDPTAFTRRDMCTGGVHSYHNESIEIRICDSPSAVAVAGGAVWAAKNEDDAIVRIDPATNAVTQTVPIGGTPWSMLGTPDELWVSDFNDDMLVRVDPATGSIVREVTGLEHGPTEMLLTADGLWVLNYRVNRVTRLDRASARAVAVIDTDINPQALALVGDEVWVRTQHGMVDRIDPRANAIVGRFAASDGQGRPAVDRVAVTPSGVWFPGLTLRRFDPASLTIVAEIPVASYAVVPDADGSLWVLDVAGSLEKIRP